VLVRRLARPMLAGIFLAGGAQSLRQAPAMAPVAEPVAPPIARRLPVDLPEDPTQLVRINGAAQVLGGLALATGRFPRVAALVLAATLGPTTLAGHRFWEETDAGAKANQQQHFLKNVGLFGGLLLAAVDTGGAPSLGWRARRAGADLTRSASETYTSTREALGVQ
jgi:putative oxidoreductase